MLFTTSWDDGYALDLKLASLLDRYRCKGTFYVCPALQNSRQMLSEEEIRALAVRHEIGAHSLTHPKLTLVSQDAARREISGSKEWVERVTGRPCTMFCYPKGRWNDSVRALVQEAGFLGARSTQAWKFSATDPFTLPMSMQVMPFPVRGSFRPLWKFLLDPFCAFRIHWSALNALGIPLIARSSWLRLAIACFEHAKNSDAQFFHLYGHSHELERFHLWEPLEAFLAYVAQSNVRCVTNGELVEELREKRA
ncbi:MAG: polysaccharide deacetylase family protein [Candidatus Peribacteraceae bacterium]|nr:polysaccharide deacetylase family protein [Candidatus Peribacteraceae bacterium]